MKEKYSQGYLSQWTGTEEKIDLSNTYIQSAIKMFYVL